MIRMRSSGEARASAAGSPHRSNRRKRPAEQPDRAGPGDAKREQGRSHQQQPRIELAPNAYPLMLNACPLKSNHAAVAPNREQQA